MFNYTGNIKDLNLLTLPLAFTNKQRYKIPAVPGIYFAINKGVILYVGKASSLKARLNGYHHVISKLNRRTDYEVRYVVCDLGDLDTFESYFIHTHHPALNRSLPKPIDPAGKDWLESTWENRYKSLGDRYNNLADECKEWQGHLFRSFEVLKKAFVVINNYEAICDSHEKNIDDLFGLLNSYERLIEFYKAKCDVSEEEEKLFLSELQTPLTLPNLN